MNQTLSPEQHGATLHAVIKRSIIFMGASWKMRLLERSHRRSAHLAASLARAGCAAEPCQSRGTLEGWMTMFKAEQKAMMPKGCRRNMPSGSKIPTINSARDKGAKELPKCLPSKNHHCMLDLLNLSATSQPPFKSVKPCPCAQHPSCPWPLRALGCAPQSCTRGCGGACCLFHTRRMHLTLGRTYTKCPARLNPPNRT